VAMLQQIKNNYPEYSQDFLPRPAFCGTLFLMQISVDDLR
jgi:hypothetical protein